MEQAAGPDRRRLQGDGYDRTWKAATPSAYPPDANAPGGGYDAYGMTLCGFFGCAESQDFYYVLPRKRAISGIVLANETTATGHPTVVPIDNAVIQIKGPQSGTAVTGPGGFLKLPEPDEARFISGFLRPALEQGARSNSPPAAVWQT